MSPVRIEREAAGKTSCRRRAAPTREVVDVLLLIAVLLVLLFGGLGFAAHILWLGLVLGLIVAVAHFVAGSARRI
jgi:hypothetical protein